MASGSKNYMDTLNVGVASILDPSVTNSEEVFLSIILPPQSLYNFPTISDSSLDSERTLSAFWTFAITSVDSE